MANIVVNVYIFDLAIWRIRFAGQAPGTQTIKTVREWCQEQNADLCFNLGLFKMIYKDGKLVAGESSTYVKAQGKDLSYGYMTSSEMLEIDWANRCHGYSNGIINGVVKVNHPMGGSRTRNGIGKTVSGKIIIAQSSTKVTETAFCNAVNQQVKARGETVKLFILEDGGGSTSSYSARSKLTFAPEGGRPVTTVVCLNLISPQRIGRILYKDCKGEDVRLYQTIVGGLEADGHFGPASGKKTKSVYAALGYPAVCQQEVVWTDLLRSLGLA